MAHHSVKEVSGLALLRQPATPALARYLNDLRSTLGFRAYLWQLIVKADYGAGDSARLPNDLPAPDSAVAQMEVHSRMLDEILFCQAVNSFLTYLADLMTLIYEKYPQKRVVLGENDREDMLNTLGYGARQLDLRAIQKFVLQTIEPKLEGSIEVAPPQPDRY
jgi:hypothetical protein